MAEIHKLPFSAKEVENKLKKVEELGDLNNLNTENKTSLVDATNEVINDINELTAADIDAVNNTGDTMSGVLSINMPTYPTYRLFETDTGFSSNIEQHDGVVSVHTGISGQKNYRSLQLYHDSRRSDVKKSLCLKDVDAAGEQKFHTILHDGNKDLIKPEDIGAVKKTGDTMTGTLGLIGDYVRLVFRDSTKGYAYLEKAKDDNGNVALYNERDTNNRSALQLYSENADEAGLLRLIVKKGGVSTERKVLHTGNITDLGVAQIETGSYIGTGSSHSLTFSKSIPKLLVIIGGGGKLLVSIPQSGWAVYDSLNGTWQRFIASSAITVSEKSVSDIPASFSESGVTHYYTAFY